MHDLFATPTVRAGVGVAVLCVMIAVGFYVVSIFRDYAADDQENGIDPLSKLQEMHRKGDISDEEFRTIKARTHRQPDVQGTTDESTSQGDLSSNRQA